MSDEMKRAPERRSEAAMVLRPEDKAHVITVVAEVRGGSEQPVALGFKLTPEMGDEEIASVVRSLADGTRAAITEKRARMRAAAPPAVKVEL